ncbi:MAG: chemotaxis protein CheW [Nostocaceae cyanobacterium]|nr:chemotaxis protein CheW [Nostocaceae cyanobacterium]
MKTTQKFLAFKLGVKDTAVISLENVTEVLQISLNQICGVPQMHSCVLGIYNWRGEMIWLVDLEDMLGYASLSQGSNMLSQMMAIVVQKDGKYLGLLVRQLMDIEWLDKNQIKPYSGDLFSPEVSSFVEGYFINNDEEIIISLDAGAIIEASMWGIHN